LKTIYNRGRVTGSEISDSLKINFSALNSILNLMRRQNLIDIVGQKGNSDASMEYELKPPKGNDALQEAMNKCAYYGPAPLSFDEYVETFVVQTIRNFVVTRRSIHRAFQDLVITPEVFNEIGPAMNSAASIFLFGFPGNGKTAIAERITRLMGDDIFVPYAVE